MGERKQLKAILSIGLLAFTASVLFAHTFGYRVRPDELMFALDITAGLTKGNMPGHYMNGQGYQAATILLLTTTGLSYRATAYLSPAIGIISLLAILLLITRLFQQSVSNQTLWWGIIPVGLSPFAFPGFINRLRETSHKTYTFTLVFTLIYLAVQIKRQRLNRRYIIIMALSLVALGFINYIWATVYATYIGTYLFGVISVALLSALASIVLVGVGLGILYTSNIDPTFYWHIYNSLIEFIHPENGAPRSSPQVETIPREVGGAKLDTRRSRGSIKYAIRLIQSWGTISIGPVMIPIWILYISSVAFAALVTAASAIVSIKETTKNLVPSIFQLKMPPLEKLTLTTSAFFGAMFVVAVFGGTVATAKRLIVLPGIFGIVYMAAVLSDPERAYTQLPTQIAARRRLFLALGTIILLFTLVLAIPRFALDGIGPYNTYVGAKSVAAVNWSGEFGPGCLHVTTPQMQVLYTKLTGSQPPQIVDAALTNQVYSSGEGVVVCK